MKIALRYIAGSRESYLEEAQQVFVKKIHPLCKFEIEAVKAKRAARENLHDKAGADSERLFTGLDSGDLVILFDENGKDFSGSIDFSRFLVRAIESGRRRLVFLIGGPYGVTKEFKARADHHIRLSSLTMNHHVAQIVALEQIYRGLSIWKSLPYHNA